MRRISISGSIAVGKTTLLHGLKEREPLWWVAPEVVERHRFLDRFYGDPKRWAFHSRVEFLAMKGMELSKSLGVGDSPDPPEVLLFDRTVPELITFARVMRAANTLDDDEFVLYHNVYELIVDSMPKFDATLWLHADIEVSLARIQHRGRPYEQGVGAPYLESLHAAYREWFDALAGEKLEVDTSSDGWWQERQEELVGWVRGHAD